ncbi:hypothetical protein POM88_032303 [Heracleum sosnowskyi]|uniref:Uncharacterized protein n=1 Tax=Heracleum sosnowskyi TaxID=360622 RepID=A0AAD8MHE4_9APIA|nr:hypothetical protein POM88_032303 [Heracleum sosnowskyi]
MVSILDFQSEMRTVNLSLFFDFSLGEQILDGLVELSCLCTALGDNITYTQGSMSNQVNSSKMRKLGGNQIPKESDPPLASSLKPRKDELESIFGHNYARSTQTSIRVGRMFAGSSFFEPDLMDQVAFESLCDMQLFSGDADMRTKKGTWDVTIAKCGTSGTHLIKFKVDYYSFSANETVHGCYFSVKDNLYRFFLVENKKNLYVAGEVVTVMVSGKRGSGCKEEGNRKREEHKEGTTCATVLTRAFYAEGYNSIASGINVMDLRSGINMAVGAVVSNLKNRATMTSTQEDIVYVATIAANGERDIADLFRRAMKKVRTLVKELDVVEGMKLGRAPGFGDNRRAILDDIDVLTGGEVTSEECGSSLDKIDVLDDTILLHRVGDRDKMQIEERYEEEEHGCTLRTEVVIGTSKDMLFFVRYVDGDQEIKATQGDAHGIDEQGAAEHGVAQ